MKENEKWLEEVLPLYSSLTQSVITITERLLRSNNIPFLSISGRTKDKKSTLEKIDRKGYKKPSEELTDLSGIRIILYSETDVDNVSKIINNSFSVDIENSSNKDDLLAKNEIGYRSIHMVCDLGSQRIKLPEFQQFKDMKFEFQIRTVLQHAWAELSHDRDYKFNNKLPKKLERKLYLFAGMLEIVDNGLDELSNSIDDYISEQATNLKKGDYNQPIDALNLKEFMKQWKSKNKVQIELDTDSDMMTQLIMETKQFGLNTIDDIKNIIPNDIVKKINKSKEEYTLLGLIRVSMIISDYKRFRSNVSFSWSLGLDDIIQSYFTDKELHEIKNMYKIYNF